MPIQFTRRTYRHASQLWADVRFMTHNRKQLRAAMRGSLSPAFRERLMMVVTAVNACRYCSYYHAREALAAGIPQDEIDRLLSGAVEAYDPREATALLYAQHWAESDANPDPQAAQRLVETYGSDVASAIEVVLRMIRAGNYMGNTLDYVLFRVTGGRRGIVHSA
jgi:AhpD family alkylhydroperoxidase